MTTDKKPLPDPPVPADLDLRDLQYMPLLGDRLFSSDFELHASDAEFRIGLRLWWAAWKQQVPAASLPNNERALCKLAGLDDNLAKWRRVRERALHGFELCSDGRLYHMVLAQQALIAEEKRFKTLRKTEADLERQERVRAERKQLFQDLRDRGVTPPPWSTPMEEVRIMHAQHIHLPIVPKVRPPSPEAAAAALVPPVTRSVTGTVTVTAPVSVTPNVTPGVTATVTQPVTPSVTESVTPIVTAGKLREGEEIPNTSVLEHAPTASREAPSPAAAVCRALKTLGLSRVNPSHPLLLALLRAGATQAEFVEAAASAMGKSDPFSYVLGVVKGRREDAAKALATVHQGALPNRQEAQEQRNRAVAEQWAKQGEPT